MNILEVPHGINVVIETNQKRVIIGRFDSTNGFTALLHDADSHEITEGEDVEAFVSETATYGVDVNHKDLQVDVPTITRIRLLGDIAKIPLS